MARMSEMMSVYGNRRDNNLRYAMVGMYLWGKDLKAIENAEKNAESRYEKFKKHHKKSYFGKYRINPVDESRWKDWKQSVAIAYFA